MDFKLVSNEEANELKKTNAIELREAEVRDELLLQEMNADQDELLERRRQCQISKQAELEKAYKDSQANIYIPPTTQKNERLPLQQDAKHSGASTENLQQDAKHSGASTENLQQDAKHSGASTENMHSGASTENMHSGASTENLHSGASTDTTHSGSHHDSCCSTEKKINDKELYGKINNINKSLTNFTNEPRQAPLVNALLRISPNDRENLLTSMYLKARDTIKNSVPKTTPQDVVETLIFKEADRLLEVFIAVN